MQINWFHSVLSEEFNHLHVGAGVRDRVLQHLSNRSLLIHGYISLGFQPFPDLHLLSLFLFYGVQKIHGDSKRIIMEI